MEQVNTLSSKSMSKALLGNLFGIFGYEFFILCLEKSLPLAALEKLTWKSTWKKKKKSFLKTFLECLLESSLLILGGMCLCDAN